MKNKLTLFLFAAFSASSFAFVPGKPVNDTMLCLEITGKAMFNGTQLAGVTVVLTENNKEVSKTPIPPKGKFLLVLKKNSHYTVKISKNGFVTRSVSVDTQLPPGTEYGIYRFDMEVELFKENKNINNDYLDFPVALISYDKEKDVFNYSKKYTATIKKKIQHCSGGIKMVSKS